MKPSKMSHSGLSHRLLVSFNVANDALILNVCNQFIRAGQKPAEQGRGICLVVAKSEIDGWWDALERSGNNVWRQHILRIERNESHSARGCDQRHGRRYVLAFVLCLEHDPNLRRIILNHSVQYRRRSRRADIDLADKILWANPSARGQAMVCRQHCDQGLPGQQLESHASVLFFRAEKGYVQLPARYREGKFWRGLT